MEKVYRTLWQSGEWDPLADGPPWLFLSHHRLVSCDPRDLLKDQQKLSRWAPELIFTLPWIYWLRNWNPSTPEISMGQVLDEMSTLLVEDRPALKFPLIQMIQSTWNREGISEAKWQENLGVMRTIRLLDQKLGSAGSQDISTFFALPLDAWTQLSKETPTPLRLPLNWINAMLHYLSLDILSLPAVLGPGTSRDFLLIHQLLFSLLEDPQQLKTSPLLLSFSSLLDPRFCQGELERILAKWPALRQSLDQISQSQNCLLILSLLLESTYHPFETFSPFSSRPLRLPDSDDVVLEDVNVQENQSFSTPP